MKKAIALILCTALLLLCSCGGNTEEASEAGESDIKLTVACPAVAPDGIKLPETVPENLLETLNKRLNNQTFCCAMYYVDLKTGFTISYNADRLFGAASLIKAPYLIYILKMVESGELSLDQEFTYKASIHKFGGTGTVKDLPDGSKLTLREIIEHICYESDNSAFRMLYNTTDGVLGLIDFHYKAMADYKAPYVSGTYGSVLNAGGVGRMFADIYKRAENGDEIFQWYVGLLKQANENKFIRGGLPVDENSECIYEVAHKYGEDIKALNDAAIVYCGDRPYVLVILTDYTGIYTRSFMNRISSDVYNIHMSLISE